MEKRLSTVGWSCRQAVSGTDVSETQLQTKNPVKATTNYHVSTKACDFCARPWDCCLWGICTRPTASERFGHGHPAAEKQVSGTVSGSW